MPYLKKKSDTCLNCGYLFTDADNYCPVCGQENHDINIPLKHFIKETLEGTLHFDTKIFRTFFSLMFKPGYLTSQYNEGKRIRYVPPLRLYIFISFLFFITISIVPHKTSPSDNKSNFDFEYNSITPIDLKGLEEIKIDSLMSAKKIEKGGFEEYVIHKLWNITNAGRKEFYHSLMKNISYMMFILMPFFGWLVFLLNKKRKKYYFEYLIYSVHFHGFVFLLLLIYIVTSSIWGNIQIFRLLLIWICFYLYKSFRNTFHSTRIKTFLKSSVLFFLYLVSVLGFLTITVIISVAFF